MLPDTGDSRKLSEILKDAGSGKEADQAEVSAAVTKNMIYFLPFITFFFAISVPAALGLYLLSTSAFGLVQQRKILGQDQEEMQYIAAKGEKEEIKKQISEKKPAAAKKQSTRPAKPLSAVELAAQRSTKSSVKKKGKK